MDAVAVDESVEEIETEPDAALDGVEDSDVDTVGDARYEELAVLVLVQDVDTVGLGVEVTEGVLESVVDGVAVGVDDRDALKDGVAVNVGDAVEDGDAVSEADALDD